MGQNPGLCRTSLGVDRPAQRLLDTCLTPPVRYFAYPSLTWFCGGFSPSKSQPKTPLAEGTSSLCHHLIAISWDLH